MGRLIGTTQRFDVAHDIDSTYTWVVHRDTPIVLVTKHGVLPGFKSYEFITGDWTQDGSSRRITLDDGSQATETIKSSDKPNYFDYELTDFSAPALRALFKRAYGQWWFTAPTQGKTHIVWTYSFEPQRAWLTPVVWVFMRAIYRGYLKSAAGNMLRISENEGLGVTP